MNVSEIEGEDRPLEGASDEEIALAVEEVNNEVRETAEEVTRALLNEETALTDEQVGRLWETGNALAALSRTLVDRVPPQHQVSTVEK